MPTVNALRQKFASAAAAGACTVRNNYLMRTVLCESAGPLRAGSVPHCYARVLPITASSGAGRHPPMFAKNMFGGCLAGALLVEG